MPYQLLSITFLATLFFPPLFQASYAGKVYQWTDGEGDIHIGNIPAGEVATVIYTKADADRVYRWSDKNGRVHFSDTPPSAGTANEIREIEIDESNADTNRTNHYSIIRQAERMAQSRRQLEEKRLLENQNRLEELRIKEELEVIRLNKLLRTQGYGQRPYGYPYANIY